MKNKQVLLARRPRGGVEEADFRIVETETPAVQDGQLLTRVHYLSLDPYMRGRMDESKSYAPSQPLGAVMIGGTVAEVMESKKPGFKPGDFVVGMAGWQQYQVTDGAGLRKIDDACVDYKADSFKDDFHAATAKGIDVVFENVGGMVLDAALLRMNAFGRIAISGLIAGYGGQSLAIQNVRSILVNRLLIEGFIVAEHMELWPQALAELSQHVAAKRIRYRETVAQGLSSAPRAFVGLLKGENVGKQLVKLV